MVLIRSFIQCNTYDFCRFFFKIVSHKNTNTVGITTLSPGVYGLTYEIQKTIHGTAKVRSRYVLTPKPPRAKSIKKFVTHYNLKLDFYVLQNYFIFF